MVPDLIPSQIYRRRDLHERFGGQRQGGIATPASSPVVLLFTGSAGVQHGYDDGFSDGVFCYFGEGQKGDMQWVRGNLAIRDHVQNGRDLLLFQMLTQPRSHVRYLGPFACAGWEYRNAPDQSGALRQAIVFQLAAVGDNPETDHDGPTDDPIAALRAAALAAGAETPAITTQLAATSYAERSRAVRLYALARAAGKCEGCGSDAPFLTPAGRPFLEVHHIRRLTDGGPDTITGVAAICPNCHRAAHHGRDRVSLNDQLAVAVKAKENLPS